MLDTLNIVGKPFEELAALFFCDIANDDDFYDVLACNLARGHRKQLEAMLDCLSGKRLRAAICGLGLAGSVESNGIIREYLSHADPFVASAAIDALRRTGSIDWSSVAHCLKHSSPYVRGAALRFAKDRMGAGALPILREALHDPDAIVRQNSLDELEGLVSADDLQWITPYLNDPSVEVREAAVSIIEAITG